MTIEKQIENLIKAIEANTNALLAMQQQAPSPAKETVETPTPLAPPLPTAEDFVELDREGLKDLALSIIRNKPAEKETIKNYLATYGAATIAKLKDEHLADVQNFLEGLK